MKYLAKMLSILLIVIISCSVSGCVDNFGTWKYYDYETTLGTVYSGPYEGEVPMYIEFFNIGHVSIRPYIYKDGSAENRRVISLEGNEYAGDLRCKKFIHVNMRTSNNPNFNLSFEGNGLDDGGYIGNEHIHDRKFMAFVGAFLVDNNDIFIDLSFKQGETSYTVNIITKSSNFNRLYRRHYKRVGLSDDYIDEQFKMFIQSYYEFK